MAAKLASVQLRPFALGVLALGLVAGGWFFFAGSPTELQPHSSSAAPAEVRPTGTRTRAAPSSLTATEAITSTRFSNPSSALEKRGALDPGSALAEALREPDPERRQRLVMTILRAWAAVDPDAAAGAAIAWPGSDRVEPVAAVLAGVAGRPEEALRLGTFFCREDPSWAPEHGQALIASLSGAGHFAAAVGFALAGGSTVEGEERTKWLTTAFAAWAQREPRLAALAATRDLPESGMQEEAVLAVVAHWHRLNPGGLENFIAQLPVGPERAALDAALTATVAR